jgi:hypothetical protein
MDGVCNLKIAGDPLEVGVYDISGELVLSADTPKFNLKESYLKDLKTLVSKHLESANNSDDFNSKFYTVKSIIYNPDQRELTIRFEDITAYDDLEELRPPHLSSSGTKKDHDLSISPIKAFTEESTVEVDDTSVPKESSPKDLLIETVKHVAFNILDLSPVSSELGHLISPYVEIKDRCDGSYIELFNVHVNHERVIMEDPALVLNRTPKFLKAIEENFSYEENFVSGVRYSHESKSLKISLKNFTRHFNDLKKVAGCEDTFTLPVAVDAAVSYSDLVSNVVYAFINRGIVHVESGDLPCKYVRQQGVSTVTLTCPKVSILRDFKPVTEDAEFLRGLLAVINVDIFYQRALFYEFKTLMTAWHITLTSNEGLTIHFVPRPNVSNSSSDISHSDVRSKDILSEFAISCYQTLVRRRIDRKTVKNLKNASTYTHNPFGTISLSIPIYHHLLRSPSCSTELLTAIKKYKDNMNNNKYTRSELKAVLGDNCFVSNISIETYPKTDYACLILQVKTPPRI